MSVPVMTLTSPFKTTISHPPDISTNSRDASFSSYLDGAEESFVLKLASKTAQISTPNDHIFRAKHKSDDKELDVFDAEKYFNESNPNHNPKAVIPQNPSTHHPKKDEPLEIFAIKQQQQPSKPTLSVRSESSSNSRSALLHANPKHQQTKKPNRKGFLASVASCNCSCADKNSVDIDDYNTPENCSNKSKQGSKIADHLARKSLSDYNSSIKLERSDHFTFPVFNPVSKNQDENDVAKRKKSLEVFSSPIPENGKISSGLEKSLTITTTWDAIAPINPQEEIKLNIPSISSDMRNGDDDDSDSDLSSDLFEIESFSKGNTNSTTCYAPSEVSIEWSVITASAADYSVLSDSDEIISEINSCHKKASGNAKSGSFKEMPKLRSGLLSGCKSQKAVKIAAGNAVKANDRRSLRTESFTSATRFHDEGKLTTFDGRSGRQHSFDARVLSQPRHGNGARLLYA